MFRNGVYVLCQTNEGSNDTGTPYFLQSHQPLEQPNRAHITL